MIAIREGLASIDLPEEILRSAANNLEEWLQTDKLQGLVAPSEYRHLLKNLIEKKQFDLLIDSFYQVIPFGTGGRRGSVGIGPNRINPYTIASSIQGHAAYLHLRFPDKEQLKVVLAWDVRRFHDLRKTYAADLPNPLIGLSSKDLALTAASVYTAAGIIVYMLPDELDDYVSTPELSFLIRHLEAQGGVNISASHNHPDDNGSKFYNHEGGQEIPPDDETLAKIVEEISEIQTASRYDLRKSDLVLEIPADARKGYIDMNLGLRLNKEVGNAKFVFTGLHGIGINTVGRCLEEMGYVPEKQLFIVEEQRKFESEFHNVKFRSPNPEVPESLELGIERARQVGADLLLATDPDADRLGGAARDGDRYAFVSGNEFAAVLTRYRLESLQKAGQLPKQPLAIKTQVTTELISRVVEAHNGVVIGDLLVGFKYVAAVLAALENTGQYRGVKASIKDFIIATEESHGLMMTPAVRDKDAAGAAVVLAEMTSELHAAGLTPYDYLIETYKLYGYHSNTVRSTVMRGAMGSAAISRVQQLLREDIPKEIGGRKVLQISDYWDESRYGPFVSETDKSSRNLITYFLEGGVKATIRPSGTEPKNKVYVELAAKPLGKDASREEFESHRPQIDKEVKQFSNSFLQKMLALIDISLPEYAFELSDLLPLTSKIHFCEQFLPEFESQTEDCLAGTIPQEAVSSWIDESLKSYGSDARALVNKGFEAYCTGVQQSGQIQLMQRIFMDQD